MTPASIQGFSGYWKTLQDAGETDMRIPGLQFQERHVRVMVDGDSSVSVMIPLEFHPGPLPRAGESIQVTSEDYIFQNGDQGRYLEITCSDSTLHEPFDSVVTDLFRRLGQQEAVADVIRDCFTDFRELLQIQGDGRMTREKEIGLAGELLFMDALIDYVDDPLYARENGTEEQDFQMANSDVEVKTTSIRGKKEVGIHGLGQLLPKESRPLYLCHVRTDLNDSGRSIGEIVEALTNQGVDPQRLAEFLDKEGWVADGERPIRFQKLGLDFYQVTDGFPRIATTEFVSGEAPAGIDDVNYQLHLNQARSFMVETSLNETLKEICQ
ncbi:PD-(D/E)XK motif protein [Planctomycetota bacterium]|nr:PD-(D/E)XK motif protein [Planctomycetota bacterium]